MAGKLKTDALFMGLTRSATILKVSYMYFSVNLLITMVAFVVTSDIRVFLMAVVIHLFGVMIMSKEPLAVEIWILKLQKFGGVRNKAFYNGLSSYNPF